MTAIIEIDRPDKEGIRVEVHAFGCEVEPMANCLERVYRFDPAANEYTSEVAHENGSTIELTPDEQDRAWEALTEDAPLPAQYEL